MFCLMEQMLEQILVVPGVCISPPIIFSPAFVILTVICPATVGDTFALKCIS